MTEVVVGVGNPTMRDDGVGHRIVDELDAHPDCPEDLTLTRTGTAAFLALEALSGADRAVVVDAVSTGADPGTVHQYRYRDGAFEDGVPNVLMHDLSFSDALQAGSDAYDLPEEIIVIGVEPASLTVGLGVSDPVEAAIPTIVTTVLDALTTPEPEPQ
ncbi:MAG: hydrogenase maturation protease [Halodesulfurarchaeum sp.]